MAGRILLAKVVHGVNEPDPEKVRPQPIDGSTGKVLIVFRRDPLRECRPRAHLGTPLRLLAVKKPGHDDLVRPRNLHGAPVRGRVGSCGWPAGPTGLNPLRGSSTLPTLVA